MNNPLKCHYSRILVDAREFVPGRFTGIGRFLSGLLDALIESDFVGSIVLVATSNDAVPLTLRNREKLLTRKISDSFLKSEKELTSLSKNDFNLIISPYPKIPLFGSYCHSINTVHDVLDLTHPEYKKSLRVYLDRFRLQMALRKSGLTWYDSLYSLEETKKLVGFAGKNLRVRHPGIDERFNSIKAQDENIVLKKYNLQPGYILAIGNGLPHKNLGVLLKIADNISRKLVFIGVSRANQKYWKARYPNDKAVWIKNVEDRELPSVIRGAFCIAQPSTAEGYGYPPLEAMASGIPAVVSNIPVLIETTGGNTLYAEPEDPKEWIGAFEALGNKNYYRTQTAKGLKWVDQFIGRKGWAKHIYDIEELIMGEEK